MAFVSWFLDEARRYGATGSFVVYAYGRPRNAAWARLAQEVQDAATSLGSSFVSRRGAAPSDTAS
jgi:hypothetical protein